MVGDRWFFGTFEYDPAARELRDGGETLSLEPKALDVLEFLLAHRDRAVSRAELLEVVWQGRAVVEEVVTRAIVQLRRALGDDGSRQAVIRTLPRRGYRFVAEVRRSPRRAGSLEERLRWDVFVGREHVLSTIEQAIQRCLLGKGSVLVLVGPAGIGKTRVVQQGLSTPLAGKVRHLWSWGTEEGEGVPYQIWTQLASSLAEQAPELLTTWDARRSLEELGDVAAGRSDPASALRRKVQLSDDFARGLVAASTAHPLILVFDDFQWADQASLDLFERVARQAALGSLLVICCHRSEDPGGRSAIREGIIERHAHALRIDLPGLATDEISEYLESATGQLPPADLVAELARITQGNPFFLREFVRSLAQDGRLAFGDLVLDWRLDAPPSVRAVILRRLSSLRGQGREAVELASVIGERVSLGLLAAAWPTGGARLDEGLEDAVRGGWLRRRKEGEIEFVHALAREVVYDQIRSERLRELHRAVAAAMEATPGAGAHRSATLAHHLERAATTPEQVDQAVQHLVAAMGASLAACAFPEAASHLERARQLLKAWPGGDREAMMRLSLGVAQIDRATGDGRRAIDAAKDAVALARELGDPCTLAHAVIETAVWSWWHYFARLFDASEWIAYAREALDTLPEAEIALRARTLMSRGAFESYAGLHVAARASTAQALSVAHSSGVKEVVVDAALARCAVLGGPDHRDERREAARYLEQVAGQPHAKGWISRMTLAAEALERGDGVNYRRFLSELAGAAAETGMPILRWCSEVAHVNVDVMAAQFDSAIERARRAARLGEQMRLPASRAFYVASLSGILQVRGVLTEELASEGDRVVAALVPKGDPRWQVGVMLAQLDAGLLSGLAERFEAYIGAGLEAFARDGAWLGHMSELGRVAARVGDDHAAGAIYEMLEPHADYHATVGGFSYLGPVSRALAALAWKLGMKLDARRWSEHASAAAEAVGARSMVPRILYERALALEQSPSSSDREEGRLLLRDCRDRAQALGLEDIARRGTEVLGK